MNEKEILARLADLIIPENNQLGMPSAADPEIFAVIFTAAEKQTAVLSETATFLEAETARQYDCPFTALPPESAVAVAEQFRKQCPDTAETVATMVAECYYSHPRVRRAMAIPERPPFPDGFEIAESDWSLLAPVQSRAKLYRE